MNEFKGLESEKNGQFVLELSGNDTMEHSKKNSEVRVESTHQGLEAAEAESLETEKEYTHQEHEAVSVQAPTERLSLEDGVPETLLEKLDETYDLVEEDFTMADEEFAENTELTDLESATQNMEFTGHWYTLYQRKCWAAGFPGQDGFKYL